MPAAPAMPLRAAPAADRLLLSVATVDERGRVRLADAESLGWEAGDHLSAEITATHVTLRRSTTGRRGTLVLLADGRVTLPAGARYRLGLASGARVAVTADIKQRDLQLAPGRDRRVAADPGSVVSAERDLADRLVKMCEVLDVEPATAAEVLARATSRRSERRLVPTVAEYLGTVAEATTPGARRTYEAYWMRLVDAYGERRLDEVTPSMLESLRNALPDHPGTRRRSNWRNGYQAQRSAVQAWRRFWTVAVRDHLVGDNPASDIPMEPRKPSGRRGLTRDELEMIFDAAVTNDSDPCLAGALIRLLAETGARRGGVLGLTVGSLNIERQTLTLLEKRNNPRELPISRGLVEELLALARERGVDVRDATAPLLRYPNGRPITRKRIETLFAHIQEAAPFPDARYVSCHWLRHTAVTMIERVPGGGEAVAAAFAGHVPARSRVTGLYTTAPAAEVIRAWCAVWQEPHPLADRAVPLSGQDGSRTARTRG